MKKNQKKIAIITNWFPTKEDPNYGIFIYNQAILLSQEYEVHVVILIPSFFIKTKKYIKNGLTIHEHYRPRLPNKNKFLAKRWIKQYVDFFTKVHARENFTLVHAHDFMPSWVAHSLKLALDIPAVASMHNTMFVERQFSNWQDQLNEQSLVNMPVICNSQGMYDAITELYPSAQLNIIPYHIDTDRFNVKINKSKVFQFLYVGYIEPRKQVREIVEAFEQLNRDDCILLLIGDYQYESNELMEKIENIKSIDYKGGIPHSEIAKYFQTSHCLLSFSQSETFGITVQEALACGIPVIYKRSGGPEHFVPDYAGIQVKNSIDDLKKAMDQMIENYNEYDGEKIRQYAVESFSAHSIKEKLIRLYKKSLSN